MLLPAIVALAPLSAWAQGITVTVTGDALTIRAPGLTFLKGEPLQSLKDGRSVRVELGALILAAPGKTPATTVRRIFAFSYDLWEERFAVAAVDRRSPPVSNLTASAAEAWCIDQLAVPLASIAALGRDPQFWIRLEYRILEADTAPPADEQSGFTLEALIDVLSRRRRPDPSVHALEGGPFRLPARRGGSSSPR